MSTYGQELPKDISRLVKWPDTVIPVLSALYYELKSKGHSVSAIKEFFYNIFHYPEAYVKSTDASISRVAFIVKKDKQ